MARFTGRLLGLVDRLFVFPAGVSGAPTEYSVESPIQPVHELGRGAELASGIGGVASGGYWLIGPQHAHGAANQIQTVTDPRTVIRASGVPGVPPSDLDMDVWYMQWSAGWEETALNAIATASAAIWFPIVPGRTAVQPLGIASWTAERDISDSAGGAATKLLSVDTNIPRPTLPIPLPIGAKFGTLTVSTAATTCTIAHLCWVGPRGARPPGVA